jgi:DnaA family protein
LSPQSPVAPQQLHLPIELGRESSFAEFLPGQNGEVVTELEAMAAGTGAPFVYLFGPTGTGKTHLLQASCLAARSTSRRSQYLPLGTPRLSPGALEGLEQFDLVALDDLQCVAGQDPWEEGLFCLFNSLRDRGGCLVASASSPLEALGIGLPDLRSRLQWGPRYAVAELTEADCETLLRQTAQRLGMRIPTELVRYIMTHRPRDPASLIGLVERLDSLCLREQRAPSIPLLKRNEGILP